MYSNEQETLFDIIQLSIWDSKKRIKADWKTYEEIKHHALVALPAHVMSSFSLPDDLLQVWQLDLYRQVSWNVNCLNAEKELPLTVPYVVLKGSAAAKYYPHPKLRTLGDIDIMTRREDFDAAQEQLIFDGYQLVNSIYREPGFEKNGIKVELHRSFALLNDAQMAEYLDELIIANISPDHILPDLINGLVILEHISQHMEYGLGLRQIIDWMMFVHQCLPDKEWPTFEAMVKHIGLEKLAVALTRMCEMYLGLPVREWCAGADESICDQLMEYILSCGNFGNKLITDEDKTLRVLSYATTPFAAVKLIQQHIRNKRGAVPPRDWLKQDSRFLARILKRENAFSRLTDEIKNARRRAKMFRALGIRQFSKGRVSFKNGEYVKD